MDYTYLSQALCDAGYRDGLAINMETGDIFGLESKSAEDQAKILAIKAAYDPLPAMKATKLAEIRAACDAALAPVAAAYPEREVQSWPKQLTEAESLAVNPDAPAPLIRGMAAVRPSLGASAVERVAELARRIRQNDADWSAIAGPIIGKRQALEDAVNAATSPEAVAEIRVDFS